MCTIFDDFLRDRELNIAIPEYPFRDAIEFGSAWIDYWIQLAKSITNRRTTLIMADQALPVFLHSGKGKTDLYKVGIIPPCDNFVLEYSLATVLRAYGISPIGAVKLFTHVTVLDLKDRIVLDRNGAQKNTKWILSFAHFACEQRDKTGSVVGPMAYGSFAVDGGGNLINQSVELAGNPLFKILGNTMTEVAMNCLTILNAKGVDTTRHLPPPRVLAKRARRGKPKPLEYKVLNVYKPSFPQEKAGRGGKNWTNRQHVVRQHLKNYTKGNGLCGKAHGIYVWTSFVRGDESQGRIVKDYRICART